MIGEITALTAACCWAVGSHLFGRIARAGGVPAAAMNLGKCLTATLLFWLTGVALTGRLVPDVPARNVAWLLGSGVVGLSVGDGSYFKAILSIGVRRSLLLLSMAPVFTAVGGAIWLGERLRLTDGVGIVLVVVGVALVVYEQAPAGAVEGRALEAGKERISVSGVLFALVAALGQAVGGLMSRVGMAGNVSALDASLIRLPAGLFGIVLIAGSSGGLRHTARALRSPRTFAAIAGASVIGTFLGIWLSQYSIGHAGSTAVASTLMATSPVFALPLGRWLNHDRITLRALGGTVVAVGGLAILTLGGQ